MSDQDQERKYEGFTVLANGTIFYDRKPLLREFPTRRTDEKVTGYRTPMTELREGDEFIGPDERTRYVVLTSIAEHANGWLDVRKPDVPHEWDAAAEAWTNEGFFSYSYPDTVLVYRVQVSDHYRQGFTDAVAVELGEEGAQYDAELMEHDDYRRGLQHGRTAVIDDRLAKAKAAGELVTGITRSVQVGDRVRDAKWGGTHVGTVVRLFGKPGEIGVRWDGRLAEDQMSPGEYELENN